MTLSSSEMRDFFTAIDPATGKPLTEQYPEASMDEVAAASTRAESAFEQYSQIKPQHRARFLECIAQQILELGTELIETAQRETALPAARLENERNRTTFQLNLLADFIRNERYNEPIVDGADPHRQPLPKPDLRQIQIPLGPVAVFGASNFPLAFSTAGGDTASALAAGCSVIYKAHPAHPGTSALVAKAIERAREIAKIPEFTFQMVQGRSPQLSESLVTHPLIQAVGFTGSLRVGRHLFNMTQQRPQPIPFYGELGSVNPIFVLPSALKQEIESLAQNYVQSLTLGVGQFCTNPGILVGVNGDHWEHFKQTAISTMQSVQPGFMLTPAMANQYQQQSHRLAECPAIKKLAIGPLNPNADLAVNAQLHQMDFEQLESVPDWQQEIFGPLGLIINCDSLDQMLSIAHALEGQLTASVLGTEPELEQQTALIQCLIRKVGRLIFNGFPTGVEVSPAMHHGGPYPASTDSRSTSVGCQAVYRFLRPVCLQDAPKSFR